jgi:hypothetical protein
MKLYFHPVSTTCRTVMYPNVRRWLANMRALPSWSKVNEAFYGYAQAVKDQPFITP